MKVFQKYLCELCSNSIARQRGHDEFELVVCAMNVNGFPIEGKCPEFEFEEGVVE